MLGWIERVVPQPPVTHLTNETPLAPVRDLEPAKVSREPLWVVLGSLRAWQRNPPCLCVQTSLQHPGVLHSIPGRDGAGDELLGSSRKDGESLGFAATCGQATRFSEPPTPTPSPFYPEGTDGKGRWPRGCC